MCIRDSPLTEEVIAEEYEEDSGGALIPEEPKKEESVDGHVITEGARKLIDAALTTPIPTAAELTAEELDERAQALEARRQQLLDEAKNIEVEKKRMSNKEYMSRLHQKTRKRHIDDNQFPRVRAVLFGDEMGKPRKDSNGDWVYPTPVQNTVAAREILSANPGPEEIRLGIKLLNKGLEQQKVAMSLSLIHI